MDDVNMVEVAVKRNVLAHGIRPATVSIQMNKVDDAETSEWLFAEFGLGDNLHQSSGIYPNALIFSVSSSLQRMQAPGALRAGGLAVGAGARGDGDERVLIPHISDTEPEVVRGCGQVHFEVDGSKSGTPAR